MMTSSLKSRGPARGRPLRWLRTPPAHTTVGATLVVAHHIIPLYRSLALPHQVPLVGCGGVGSGLFSGARHLLDGLDMQPRGPLGLDGSHARPIAHGFGKALARARDLVLILREPLRL